MEEFILRKAAFEDLGGMCEVLSSELATTKPATRYWWTIMENPNIHTYVCELHGDIVGVATLHTLKKLIHGGSHVGLIEDVAVAKRCAGKGLGKKLINKLVEVAEEQKCYKVILNCAEHNIGFYEKCGFEQKEVQMRLDIKK